MNKLQQDTLEIIEEYLPRIALALEEIAKELKKQNSLNEEVKSDSTEPAESDVSKSDSIEFDYSDINPISRLDAYCMLHDYDIPVKIDEYGDVVLLNGDLLIGECNAFLSPIRNGNSIVTSSHTKIDKVTMAHIKMFIAEYKALEKEISK